MSHKEYLKQVGVEIKVARIRNGLTQEALVKATGISWRALSDLELGKVDGHLLTYKRIADAMSMDLKDFL